MAGAVAWLRRTAGLIFCISSILRCLSARRSCIRCSRSVLAWLGICHEALKIRRNRPLRLAGAVRGTGATLGFTTISLVPPMLSLFRPMLSPGHPTPFSVERVVVQQLNLVFRTSKPAQKESATIEQEFFSYHRWIRSCLVANEQIGEGFDVKRKLTLLRRRRSCRSNCDYFDGITPGTLDIGKNCQHRQTNHNHCH